MMAHLCTPPVLLGCRGRRTRVESKHTNARGSGASDLYVMCTLLQMREPLATYQNTRVDWPAAHTAQLSSPATAAGCTPRT